MLGVVQRTRERKVVCLWRAAAVHGESLAWNSELSCLEFIDVPRGTVQRYWPESGKRSRLWVAPELGFLKRKPDCAAMCGSGLDVLQLSPDYSATATRVTLPGDPSRIRLNDASVDPAGNLWTGSMDRRGVNPIGALFLIGADCHWEQMDDGYTIPNGFALSSDGGALYVADSPQGVIYRYELAGNRRSKSRVVWARIAVSDGFPDGMAVDGDDHLWVALYGGGRILRYRPDGSLERQFELPVRNVTAITLVGQETKTIYVTTAMPGGGRPAKSWPWQTSGGSLLAVRVTE